MTATVGRRRRKFVARVYDLLDRVPRVAVDGLLAARNRHEWSDARERFEAALKRAGLELPSTNQKTANSIVERKLRLLHAGYVPELHLLPEELHRHGWSIERCRFHGILKNAPGMRCSYPYCARSDVAKYSTPEQTQAWTAHLEREETQSAAERRRIEKAESDRREFQRLRKEEGALITRQEILTRGVPVPPTPDFVERLGRGCVRYYYRLPIPIGPVRRRSRRREERAA